MKDIRIPANAVQLRAVDTHRLRKHTVLSFCDKNGIVQAQITLVPHAVMHPLPLANNFVRITVYGDESVVLKFDEYP